MYMDYVKTYNEAARLNDFKVFLPFNHFTNKRTFFSFKYRKYYTITKRFSLNSCLIICG